MQCLRSGREREVAVLRRRSRPPSGLAAAEAADRVKYDTDPKQSAQSRVKMLSMLADKRFKKEPWGKQPGLFPLESVTGIARARAVCRSVGAAVTAAEERPKPIVQTNFKHLNLAARRESVPPERPRSKREVI
jgi:hypothetical protein